MLDTAILATAPGTCCNSKPFAYGLTAKGCCSTVFGSIFEEAVPNKACDEPQYKDCGSSLNGEKRRPG